MDIKIFSAKDYFNYYFAGIAWLACVFSISIKGFSNCAATVEIIGKIPITILAVLLIAIPFMIGFVLNPLGNLVTFLLRKIVDDPIDWVLVLSGQKFPTTKKLCRKRISEPSRTKILEKLSTLQGGPTKYSPFFFVRNYVEIKANKNALTLVNRPLDMANLTESLLLPIPLLGFLIGEIFISRICSISLLLPIPLLGFLIEKIFISQICSIISGILFIILCYRYFQLREYWVKHNYRTFLILE